MLHMFHSQIKVFQNSKNIMQQRVHRRVFLKESPFKIKKIKI